jgi:dihydroorotase
MKPPLRTHDDIMAIREGLADGTIDAIATDHAPHYIERKEVEFIDAAFGVTGLETAMGVVQRELVKNGVISWNDVVRTMSCTPAAILGIEGGTLKVGALGDVTIYNPNAPWTVDPHSMKSQSTNTAFFDWELPGRAAATVIGGQLYLNIHSNS